MSIVEMKKGLQKAIENIEDTELLEELKFIIDHANAITGESWENLPLEVKAAIEEGMEQAKTGETISNAEFKNRYFKWFTK